MLVSVKNGYGFINRNDFNKGVFVQLRAITWNNPHKVKHSVAERETADFCAVVGGKT